MAALTSNRLYDLFDRFIHPRRPLVRPVFEFQRFSYAAGQFARKDCPSPEEADDDWLQRIELRGAHAVIELLERTGFRDQHGTMRALFVDGRCGLIHSFPVGNAANAEPERTVGEILARASNCHADGIILATNDALENVSDASRWKRLVADLYRKGEATEIFLLDHFVLTSFGWKRMFRFTGPECS